MTREHNDVQPFLDAIHRKYDDIQDDYKARKKENHWSWYLFPLLKQEGMKPRAGTEVFYLDDEDEIKAYLANAELMRYYKEFLDVLYHVVVDGKRDRRPMTAAQSLKAYLQPVDYDKFMQHVEEFEPHAPRSIQAVYAVLKGEDEPDMDKFPEPRIAGVKKLTAFQLPMKGRGLYHKPLRGGGLVQSVCMDIPLFIRLMEFAREDAKNDMQLHEIAERAVLQERGLLTMKHYRGLVKPFSRV